jgi:DNA-binding transcriptional LysR family regulator
MGVTLFERSTRSVRLTPAGASFLAEAREMLEQLTAAVRNAQRFEHGELGSLTVGFNDFAINDALPPIVMRFRTRYPDISVNLRSMSSPEMADAIRKRRLDIGFLTGAHLVGGLSHQVLRKERLVCLLPKGHRLAAQNQIALASLASEPFVIGSAAGWRSFLDVVDAYCMQAGFLPRVAQEASHSDSIVNLVAAGMGVSIYIDADWVKERRDIVMRPLAEKPPIVVSVAAWHSQLKSRALENFVAVTREVVTGASVASRKSAMTSRRRALVK